VDHGDALPRRGYQFDEGLRDTSGQGDHAIRPRIGRQDITAEPTARPARQMRERHAEMILNAGEKEWTASNTSFEGGMGIDATVPFGYESDFMRPVYPVDRVELSKWFSEKDIQNAKSRMQGWVHSLARTGR